jgi:hypothetical protein
MKGMSTPLPRRPKPAQRWLLITLLLACPLAAHAHPRPSAALPPPPEVLPPEGQDRPWGTGFEQRQQPPPGGRTGAGQTGSGQAGKGRTR